MPKRSAIHRAVIRIAPKQLGARFALTVLVTNLVAVIVATAFLLLAIRFLTPQLEDAMAETFLTSLDRSIAGQAEAADAAAAVFGVSTRVYESARTGSMPDDLRASLDAYAESVNARALVFVNAEDEIVYVYGEDAPVAALRGALTANGAAGWNPGALASDDGMAVAVARPVTGPAATRSAGWLAVSVPFRVEQVGGAATVSVFEPGSRSQLPDSRTVDDPRFRDIHLSTSSTALALQADVPGVDGNRAATVRFVGDLSLDAWFTTLMVWALAAAVVASLFGIGIGLAVARAVARPIADLSDSVSERARDTIAGRETEPLEPDDALPEELASLVEAVDSTFYDLTAHQIALASAKEDALAAKATLDVAFQDSLEGKVLITHGTVTLVNPAACTHLNARAEDVLGQPPAACFSAGALTDVSGESIDPAAILDRSRVRGLVLQLQIAGRSPRWIEVRTVQNVHDTETLLVSTRDVTEERRLEALRGEIVGMVSHDLRGPLTVITGYLDMLGDLDADSRAVAIGHARDSAERMQELLGDLLAVTRAEELFSPTELLPVDLAELAEEVTNSFRHTSSHELRFSAASSGLVLGEKKRLRQVLVNLVVNATKYSPPDTRVDMSVTSLDGVVTLAVEDHGPGVPEGEREAIFERFTRLGADGAQMSPGVGLGLYIVRAIIENHSGSVAVTDRLDGKPGARFEVLFPAATGDAS